MNVFSVVGRCGRDAETRFTPAGKSVTNWSVAFDSGYGDRKKAIWLNCSGWGAHFENIAQYIKKGELIGVTGEFDEEEYEGKHKNLLKVSAVTLINNKPKDGTTSEDKPRSKPPQQPAMAGGDTFEEDPDALPF